MVTGYKGRPGAGKSLNAIMQLWLAKKRGRDVYANIPLIDNRTKWKKRHFFFGERFRVPMSPEGYGKPWSNGMVESLEEVCALSNAIVLLDEVHLWCNARKWQDMPESVLRYFSQQRKLGVDIVWTAQSEASVDAVLRRLTATLWNCNRYGPLIVAHGMDPISKEDLGKKYLFVAPWIYDLYPTEYMVGSRDGEGAGMGRNELYEKRRREEGAVTLLADPDEEGQQSGEGQRKLRRLELPDGRIAYRWDWEGMGL